MTGRLIDADALKAQIQREIDIYFDEDGGGIHTAMEARDEIDYAPTVDAIPIEWIKQFIKKENIHISNKVGIAHMVEQWKLHPIDFEISSEPQWIPVSKKLPNKNDYVIVTTKFGVVIEAQFEVWNSGIKEWWIDNDNSFEFDDVVAWMPMPQPYRGG